MLHRPYKVLGVALKATREIKKALRDIPLPLLRCLEISYLLKLSCKTREAFKGEAKFFPSNFFWYDYDSYIC